MAVEATPPTMRTALPAEPRAELEGPAPKVDWLDDLDVARTRGQREGRSVVVVVAATWQPRSARLDRTLWADDVVRRLAADVIPLRIDASDTSDEALEHWLTVHGIDHVPAVALLAPDGSVQARLTGPEVQRDAVIRLLRRARR